MQEKKIAVFGGGCFWCTEAVFSSLRGVLSVAPGYAGGTTEDPNYYTVASGKTGHAEVVMVTYDPAVISFRDLLTVFFATHDPTTPNRQGNDVGSEYRSLVLYTTEEQREETEKFIKEIEASGEKGAPIITELKPLGNFYPAEKEHKDFYEKNRNQPYCSIVIDPKLKKVKEQFAELLKTHGKGDA